MARPDPSAARRPRGRTDSIRPPRTRSTAPSRPSPAREHATSGAPIPATVWPCSEPVDTDADWPAPLVTKIVRSFSKRGSDVGLLLWPSLTDQPPAEPFGGSDVTVADAGNGLAEAVATVENLSRTARLIRPTPNPGDTGPGSQPFWAGFTALPDQFYPPDLGGSCAGPNPAEAPPAEPGCEADLVITSLRPEHGRHQSGDRVALLAAHLLRTGGILVVLTHCDWARGELVDPTGPFVASAQSADLLYLQHVIALHVPIRAGEFAAELHHPAMARARRIARISGQPVPHHRIHSDVLVFARSTQ